MPLQVQPAPGYDITLELKIPAGITADEIYQRHDHEPESPNVAPGEPGYAGCLAKALYAVTESIVNYRDLGNEDTVLVTVTVADNRFTQLQNDLRAINALGFTGRSDTGNMCPGLITVLAGEKGVSYYWNEGSYWPEYPGDDLPVIGLTRPEAKMLHSLLLGEDLLELDQAGRAALFAKLSKVLDEDDHEGSHDNNHASNNG